MSRRDTSVMDFVLGVILTSVGVFMLFDRISVTTSWWQTKGILSPIVVITPLIIGIMLIFFKMTSKIGWILVALGMLLIIISILSSLRFVFSKTKLWLLVVMLVCIVLGLVLLARAFASLRR